MHTINFARVWLVGLSLVYTSIAQSSTAGRSQQLDSGLQVELAAPGLSAIADMARGRLGGDVHEATLPDIDQRIIGNAHLRLSGVKVRFKLDSLALVPRAGGIRMNAGIKQMLLTIDRLEIGASERNIYLGTICHGTKFHVAEKGVVYGKADINAGVAHNEINLSASAVHMPVSAKDYRAEGPGACSGVSIPVLGPMVGETARLVLHAAFGMIRPFLSTILQDRVSALLPVLSEQLNHELHPSLYFDTNVIKDMPSRLARLDAFPSRLAIDNRGIQAVLGLKISDLGAGGLAGSLEEALAPPMPAAVRYGSIGINPAVVSAAFTTLWPEGSDWIDVSDKAAGLLEASTMVALWPDLEKVKLSSNHLRLAVRLADIPELAADERTQTLTAHLPKLTLRFQVNIDNQWTDYYFIDLALTAAAKGNITGRQLAVSMAKGAKFELTGKWSDSYHPQDVQFNSDMAKELFTTLIDLFSSGPLLKTQLPALPSAKTPLSLQGLRVHGPFIGIDVVAARD